MTDTKLIKQYREFIGCAFVIPDDNISGVIIDVLHKPIDESRSLDIIECKFDDGSIKDRSLWNFHCNVELGYVIITGKPRV